MSLLTRRRLLTAAIGGCAGLGLWRARNLLQSADQLSPASGAAIPGESAAATTVFTRTSRALGTNVSITIAGADASLADRAAAAAFAELEQVEQVLSVYRPDSQLGRLNRERSLAAADERFLAVLSASLELSRRTEGAFDVTVQPLWDLHARAAREGRSPTEAEIAAARQLVDWRSIEMTGQRVQLGKAGMAITFNGIGQGYATDRVRTVLQEQGIKHALIDIGELTALGQKSAGRPWHAGIQHPRQDDAYVAVAALDGRSLATSGDYATTFAGNGRDGSRGDHHIFDPATGRSPTTFASVSVVAPTAMEADALSTAIFVVGPDRARELIESSKDVDALFVMRDGSVVQTTGFPIVPDDA